MSKRRRAGRSRFRRLPDRMWIKSTMDISPPRAAILFVPLNYASEEKNQVRLSVHIFSNFGVTIIFTYLFSPFLR